MATRAAIVRRMGNDFAGRYHHWDGYPSGLGRTLWHLYRTTFGGDLERMLATLIDEHPAGWSTINEKDFGVAPGFRSDYNQRPCVECGRLGWEHYAQEYQCRGLPEPPHPPHNYALFGHTFRAVRVREDDAPECYCHGARNEGEQLITAVTAAGSGCEYVYMLGTEAQGDYLYILSSYHPNGRKMIGMFGCGDPDAQWQPIARVALGAEEPDWDHLNRLR